MLILVQGILRSKPVKFIRSYFPQRNVLYCLFGYSNLSGPLLDKGTAEKSYAMPTKQANLFKSIKIFPTNLARWGVDWWRGQEKCNFPIWGPAAYIHTHLNESPHLHLTQEESHCSNQRDRPSAKVTFHGPAAKWEFQTNFSNFRMNFVSLHSTRASS